MISDDSQSGARLMERIEQRITPYWPVRPTRFARPPVVSLTFDDFAHSAWSIGRPILDAAGFRGTYYVASAFAPNNLGGAIPFGTVEGIEYYDLDDLAELHQSDHEIGCHTAGHRRISRLTSTELTDSLDSNARFLDEVLGERLRLDSFAYPQGFANARTKRLCAARFQSCRGTLAGINSGWFDLAQLKAVALNERFAIADLQRYLDQLSRRGGWLILFGHEVEPEPSKWGCTPKLLSAVVDAVARSGFEVDTVGRVTASFRA